MVKDSILHDGMKTLDLSCDFVAMKAFIIVHCRFDRCCGEEAGRVTFLAASEADLIFRVLIPVGTD